MAEDNNAAAAAAAAAGKAPAQQVGIIRVFLKDLSFEAPQGARPLMANKPMQPEVNVQLNNEGQRLSDELFESTLTITATASVVREGAAEGEDAKDIIYIAEVKQSGVFLLRGFEEPQLQQLLGGFCPMQLFPFARQEIANLVTRGGYPQLLLEPVNFEALHARQMAQQRANAPAPSTPQ